MLHHSHVHNLSCTLQKNALTHVLFLAVVLATDHDLSQGQHAGSTNGSQSMFIVSMHYWLPIWTLLASGQLQHTADDAT